MSTSLARQPALQRTNSDKTYCALLNEAEKGLADIAAGRSSDARASILAIQARRSALRIRNALRHESP
jgi:hypothetical protein